MCVSLSKEKGFKNTRKFLRDRLLNSNSSLNIIPQNLREKFETIPYDVRDTAVIDFYNSYKIQKDSGKIFTMHYRRKKEILLEAINIGKKHFKIVKNKLTAFVKSWKGLYFAKYSEEIPSKIEHDAKLLRTKDGKFFLSIPTDVSKENYKNRKKAVALDPGIRTFMTSFDTEGESIKFGNRDSDKIHKLSRIAQRMRDGIKRVFDKNKNKRFVSTDKPLTKPAARIEQKIKNMTNDCHHKVAKFLCLNNDNVIIPEFKTSSIAKCNIGKINKKKLYSWAHYKFRENLKTKGEKLGTKIIVGTEEYTSKTCTKCFFVDKDLGSSKVYNCPNCKLVIDRDVNAARNILTLNFEFI